MAKSLDLTRHHFGIHLTYDGYKCPLKALSSKSSVEGALKKLVKGLGMREMAPPLVVKAEANNKKDPGGYSGFVLIQESHISIHTFDKRGFVSCDVYSCKDFNVEKAIAVLDHIFKPQSKETRAIVRGYEYPQQDIY